jgi:hypothetical protein
MAALAAVVTTCLVAVYFVKQWFFARHGLR